MPGIPIFGISIPLILVVVAGYLVWVMVLLVLKKIGMSAIRRIAENTKTRVDDLFVEAAHGPLVILIFVSGGFIVARFLPSAAEIEFTKQFLAVFKSAAILAGVLFVNKFLVGLVQVYTPRVEILRDTAGIVKGLIRAVVFGLGLLVLLDSFGVSITPILASLGIGSLAIALALQPTLENLFAGIQLIIDKPIQVGHFIRLESGEEGYVERIDWRTTWIRLPPNNIVILQNKNLANSKILNYYYPDPETTITVEVSAHYDSDLEQVERVTLDVARQVLREVPAAAKDFEPAVRFHALADSGINFTVVLRVSEITKAGDLKHHFIKRLHKRYAQEGIVVPYPVRAINYRQEKAEKG